tara:strand:+ start:543 stop:719 length:177 start_codon:yes stop_codon:yes gene_type:complete
MINTKTNPSYKEVQNQLWEVKQSIKKLIDLGADYGYFQNAKITHKTLKKVDKLLTNLN